MKFLEKYYLASIEHRNIHKCGGFPYSYGQFLQKTSAQLKIKSALEIGTAIGYSTSCIALGSPRVNITTIDMVSEHHEIANSHWQELGIDDRITTISDEASNALKSISKKFDLIFIDAFGPDEKLLPKVFELLDDNSLLISTNLSLNESSRYVEALKQSGIANEFFSDDALSSRNVEITKQAARIFVELADD